MLNAVYKIMIVLLLLLVAGKAHGQRTVLDDYVALALEQNPELLAAQLTENESALGVDLARAGWRPTVDLRSDYLLAAGGRTLDFPVGDLFNPAYATLNELTESNRFPTDLENVNELLTPSNFHDTRVEVRLPLLQPRIKKEIALRKRQLEEREAATAVLGNNIRRQVRDLYYSYLLAEEAERIIDSSRLVLEEVLRVNRVLVSNDKATADIVYRTEAELATLEGRRADFLRQQLVATAALNRLLGRELTTPLTSTPPEDLPEPDADQQSLRARALDQRPELQQLDRGRRSLELLSQLQEAGGRPTLGLFLNAGAQGFLNGDWSNQPYVTGGVGFSWNLYDGKKRDIQQQRTRLRGEQLRRRKQDAANGIELQVWQAYQQRESERAQLAAAQKSTAAARATYRIIDAKYRNQQALLVELLDARNQVTTQELTANLSRFRLLQADAALRAALNE